MSGKWPNKTAREQLEINDFISAYERLFLVVESKREKPDYFLKDSKSGGIVGVELTSVYLDDRSVPDEHMKQIKVWERIPYNQDLIDQYKRRIIEKIIEKVDKARKYYDVQHYLILAIYINEYISIYMDESDWQAFVKSHENVFDDIAPFSEVFFVGLPNKKGLSVKPD
ncbi:MAG: hypothetical protein KAV87_67270 [Desulfobacteraceae bacterium]|nr:hypothetical protein [Desulfobacteraceae bacterium]